MTRGNVLHKADVVLLQPVIDLQQIGDGLGRGHELSVPRLGIVGGVDESCRLIPAHDLPDRRRRIPHKLVKQPCHRRQIRGMMRLGVGTLLSPENFLRQIILHRLPQQSLLIRTVVLVFPRHAVEIFRDPPVAERHTHLQPAVHAHAVLAVSKGHRGKMGEQKELYDIFINN